MLPAVYMTTQIIRQSVFENHVKQFVKQELNQPGTRILSEQADRENENPRRGWLLERLCRTK